HALLSSQPGPAVNSHWPVAGLHRSKMKGSSTWSSHGIGSETVHPMLGVQTSLVHALSSLHSMKTLSHAASPNLAGSQRSSVQKSSSSQERTGAEASSLFGGVDGFAVGGAFKRKTPPVYSAVALMTVAVTSVGWTAYGIKPLTTASLPGSHPLS